MNAADLLHGFVAALTSGSQVRVDGLFNIYRKDAEAKCADDLAEEHDGGFLVAGMDGRHRGRLCFHYLAAREGFRHQRATTRDQRRPMGVIG